MLVPDSFPEQESWTNFELQSSRMSFLFRVTPYNYYIVIFLKEAQELCAKGIQFRRLYVLQVLTDTTMKNTYHKH